MSSTLKIRTKLFFLLFSYCIIIAAVQSLAAFSLANYDNYLAGMFTAQKTPPIEESVGNSAEQTVGPPPRPAPVKTKHLATIIAFILVNSIIAATLLFFRLDTLFILPLEQLLSLSERYHDDSPTALYLPQQHRRPFRAVAAAISQMLDRIDDDRKKLEEKVRDLERINKELHKSRSQLVRSEKLAAIGQLSAGLAHEIGNPLAIVQGYLDMLKEDIPTDERKEFCEISQSELERVGRLVGELLRFSRTGAMEFCEIELQEFLRECCTLAMMHKSVKKSCLSLEEGAPLFFKSSADMLRQIILNALLNAADVLKEREDGLIVISGGKKETEGSSIIEITIIDNGAGVAEQDKDRIFEPFFTTKEPGSGTGLGLFVSQMLVERLGGEISAGNRKGEEGFMVSIRLPQTEAEEGGGGGRKYKEQR